jgi:hypothetical protein
MNVFPILLGHSLKMFRRSEFFSKSLFVISFLILGGFIVIIQLRIAGQLLPGYLNEHFPSRQPAEWVFGSLMLVFFSDLLMRYFFQSIPADQIRPYLHLPISRKKLTVYWIFRSWMSPFNLYLPVFFYSFIPMTINPAEGSHALGLTGIIILIAINQGLVMFIKTLPAKRSTIMVFAAAVILIAIAVLYFPDKLIKASLSMFLGFVSGSAAVFSITLALMLSIHYLLFKQVNARLQYLTDDVIATDKVFLNRWEQYLATLPAVGFFWLLEWRQAMRNKRSRINFIMFIPISILIMLFLAFSGSYRAESFIVILLMISGSFGQIHLQHVFSWESHYFDLIATRNIRIKDFIRAKYLFYLAYATLQMILVVPVLLIFNMEFAVSYVAIFMYLCGFGYYFYIRTGLKNSARFDANGRSSFNTEGISGMKFLQVLMLFMSLIPFHVAGLFIPFQYAAAFLMGITGLVFIITHNLWTNTMAEKFERIKHQNLKLYREK